MASVSDHYRSLFFLLSFSFSFKQVTLCPDSLRPEVAQSCWAKMERQWGPRTGESKSRNTKEMFKFRGFEMKKMG